MLKPEYILGLVDGEGSFTAYVKNPDEIKIVKRRTRVEPRFCLKLKEKDKTILYQLKQFFKCGNVYFQPDKRVNHQDCYRYEVTDRNDLKNIIVPFFKEYFPNLPSKKNDFSIFCEILEKVLQGEHFSVVGLRKIYQLKQKMH